MYLIEGTNQAILLDTGAGLGNIGDYVKTLTDKPLSVLITHGHVDHAMGSGTFESSIPIYLNPDDNALYQQYSDLDARKGYFNSMKLIYCGLKSLFWNKNTLEWVSVAPIERMKPLKPGDTFDIGGEILEICPGAGHTPGCITVLLQNHRILLLGDAVNNGTFMFDDHALPISEYKKTLVELKAKTEGRFDQVLFCHGAPKTPGYGDTNMINGAVWLCDAILEGRDKHIKMNFNGKTCFTAKRFMRKEDIGDHSECNIIYREQTL